MPRDAMISIRMPDETLEQLESTAEARGETRSALTQRYIDEGLRMDRHPGIVFRPGPAGRRPGLAGGPDVWGVVRVVRNVETRGDRAIAEAAANRLAPRRAGPAASDAASTPRREVSRAEPGETGGETGVRTLSPRP